MALPDGDDVGAPTVAVCVATFRRPQGIRSLLGSLDELRFRGVPPDLRVVVVDNDPTQPAFGSQEDAQGACGWPVTYVHEPARGLVAARNRSLEAAPTEAKAALFVDDDEVVAPGWLEAMLDVWTRTGATVVQGPVEPLYEEPAPRWVEDLGIFRLGPFGDGAPLHFAATNNSLVDLEFVRRHGLRFDPSFNFAGGEDEEFYGRVREAGGRIVSSADAVVYDAIPGRRMTRDWVLRRSKRKGNTIARIALKRRRGRVVRFVKAFKSVTFGVARAGTMGLWSSTDAIAGRMEIARGLGMFSAFFRIVVTEYSPQRVDADRGESA
ncbi:glycosyl transferase, family 2 [Rubellimicrobium mesophilum DSM 19309]|uniref:Glycosyl transferase, family 2 n=1 Tax=Rubellimicrobium mesophilum DSM 19309 TaxID=442562 RepID=A0A017HL84_9RHOB|nr:glycosyltransferase [Rubellimicrobium mesophilum]EYD74938.1 glycosyl transferase, family 2 [Rubellimicrobium mesophilum DSM 19309]